MTSKTADYSNASNIIDAFESHIDPSVDARYTSREARNVFAADRLKAFNAKRFLNIGGGGKRHLIKHLGEGYSVEEVDIVGDCDHIINLDQIDRLPFEDNSFDACCAFDVLEHLENFHLVNEELFRVAKDYVMLSLPNAASELVEAVKNDRSLARNPAQNGFYSKFYGLPMEKPEDRHRWFFYPEDIARFYLDFAQIKGCDVEFYVIPPTGLKRKLVKSVIGSRLYHMFFTPYIWIKLTKKA